MNRIILILLVLPLTSIAQLSKTDSLWLPLNALIGTWKGTGDGANGKGTYERSYQYVLNKKYIEVRNKAVYPPNDKNPKTYTHEDVGYISYDRMRKKFVFRQFHIEGYINQYVLDSISSDGKTIVFVSEAIENIPAGWRARETYKISNEGSLNEVFELAQPGKEFETYTQADFTKAR
jgi:hypothetical protein